MGQTADPALHTRHQRRIGAQRLHEVAQDGGFMPQTAELTELSVVEQQLLWILVKPCQSKEDRKKWATTINWNLDSN